MKLHDLFIYRKIAGGGGSDINYEDSETIDIKVGADLTSFANFIEAHLRSNGWRIEVITPSEILTLAQLSQSLGQSFFRILNDEYTQIEQVNTDSYCLLDNGTYTVSSVIGRRRGLTKLRAYKVTS